MPRIQKLLNRVDVLFEGVASCESISPMTFQCPQPCTLIFIYSWDAEVAHSLKDGSLMFSFLVFQCGCEDHD